MAISNQRIRALENGRVTFEWKDYAHRGRQSTMTLDALEFMRRFLLHVLPAGLVRIRQFGFLANRVRTQKLRLCRDLLSVCQPPTAADSHAGANAKLEDHCPICKLGRLIVIELLSPERTTFQDTS